MSLSPGARVGPYEIVGLLGSGGMGEVYRARDTRLDREVAIKVIPPLLAGIEAFRLRFEREAKAISSLSHPNICTLFDVGRTVVEGEGADAAPVHYLVMELLEGESLSDRLRKGALPIEQVLRVGREIASALEAAHRRGVIHRDLKPGNVILTPSGAKLLDFGLAKTRSEAAPAGATGSSASYAPTVQAADASPLTTQGTILGTFQYMAPEQLEGADADARTDIFALGAVLYEMATGSRAFQGSTRTSLIAAIVTSRPAPVSTVAPLAPAALDHVIQRCIEKEPAQRWQSAQDVAAMLQWIGESGSQAGVPAPVTRSRGRRESIAWGLAATLGLAALALAAGAMLRSAPSSVLPMRATLNPPKDQQLAPFDQLGLSLSPDGRTLAFVATAEDSQKQIWLRDLSDMSARPLPETKGASYPFWSPDGQSLGFFAGARLMTIDLRGGAPRAIADAPTGRGGAWSRDGVILFAPNVVSPIYRVSAAGGTPEPVTRHDEKAEITHRWPAFLPDGRHFLYVSRARTADRPEVGRLMLASLDAPEATLLIDDASNAAWVEPGYLIYGRASNLFAWRFDPGTLKLSGQAIPIAREKLSFWEAKNFVPFAASESTLVFLPDLSRQAELRWLDRDGRPVSTLGQPGYVSTARISPDGKKVAYFRSEAAQAPGDIWIHDLDVGRTYRLTQQSGIYPDPIWAPDSDRLAFLCQPRGIVDLCISSLSGGGEVRLLFESNTWKGTGSWMPDGRRLIFSTQDPGTDQDLLMLTVDTKQSSEILRTPNVEHRAAAAPDGRVVAYASNQSGRFEVYVRSLEGPPQQRQVSTDGGDFPRWRADGKELYYAHPGRSVMAVPFPGGPSSQPGAPVTLFDISERALGIGGTFQDVSPDGRRFLLEVPTSSLSSVGFHVITHWTGLLAGEGR